MLLNRIIVVVLVVALIASMVTPLTATAGSIDSSLGKKVLFDPNWEEKIASGLLESYNTEIDKKIKIASIGGSSPKGMLTLYEGSKPVIVIGYRDSIEWIKEHSRRVRYVTKLSDNMVMAYVQATVDDVKEIAMHSGVVKILPSPPLHEIIDVERKKIELLGKEDGFGVRSGSGGLLGGVKLLGAPDVWSDYNVTGEGVVVGVVDTGLDFSNPELGLETMARDENGIPLTIVMDEHFVFTNVIAVRDNEGYLNTSGAVYLVYDTLYSSIFGAPVIWYDYFPVDYYIGNITSASGVYKFGVARVWFVDWVTMYYIAIDVPVVLVDTESPGVYDTAIFDLSTAFYELSILMIQLEQQVLGEIYWREPDPSWYDYSFADEPIVKWGSEIIARDFDNDSIADFALGSLSGYYLDSFGLANSTIVYEYGVPSEIIPGTPGVYIGLDPGGDYLAIYTDWYGHGTEVATCIAARGRLNYPLYSEEGEKLYGVAPSSKLASGTGFLVGDLVPPEMWLAGYEFYYDPSLEALIPYPAGIHRSDIISNSWAYVRVAKWAHQFPGVDYFSLLFDEIVMVNMLIGNNVTIVFAAGNEGPGYSSLSTPGTGFFLIEVGGSTLFEYYQIYGYQPGYADDIIPFSSRGPTGLGYPRPDVVNIGGFEWAGTRTIEGRGYGAWLDLFGGTSQATPLTSGSLALAIQAFRLKYNYTPSPIELKVLVKSGAKDIGYPGLAQGSGRVDAYSMVKAIMEDGFKAYIPEGIRRAFIENYLRIYGEPDTYLLANLLVDTAYYTVLTPGSMENFSLVVEGYGDVEFEATEYVRVYDYTLFDGVYDFTTQWFVVPKHLLQGIDHIEVVVAYQNTSLPYPYFTVLPYSEGYMIRVDAFDWIDYSGDGVIDPATEIYRLNTEARISTEALLPIGDVQDRVSGQLVVRLRPNTEFNYTGVPPVKAKIVIRAYKEVESDLVILPESVFVNGSTVVTGIVSIPEDIVPGVIDVKIKVKTPDKDIIIPSSILVPLVLDGKSTIFLGARKTKRINDPFTPLGLGDTVYGDRPEALDWRMIPVLVTEPEIAGVAMIARWRSGYHTSLAVLTLPPGGVYRHSWGGPHVFSAFKLSSDVGYVYNPSLSDQLHGKLRMYLPIKWSLPLRDFILYYFYKISVYDSQLYEYWDYIWPMKPAVQHGLYRVLLTYECFSGSRVFDTFGLRLVVIRSSSEYEFWGSDGVYNYGEVGVSYNAGSYAPFLLADVYVFSNSSTYYAPGTLEYAYLGLYFRWEDGIPTEGYLLHYPVGYYIGTSITSRELELSYMVITNASEVAEVDTALVMYDYPWHASGYYWYNFTGSTLVIGEMVYPGVVSTSVIVSLG